VFFKIFFIVQEIRLSSHAAQRIVPVRGRAKFLTPSWKRYRTNMSELPLAARLADSPPTSNPAAGSHRDRRRVRRA